MASGALMAPAELVEIDDVFGEDAALRRVHRVKTVLRQTTAEPPHKWPDDHEADELDQKHPGSLGTFGVPSSATLPFGWPGLEAETTL